MLRNNTEDEILFQMEQSVGRKSPEDNNRREFITFSFYSSSTPNVYYHAHDR